MPCGAEMWDTMKGNKSKFMTTEVNCLLSYDVAREQRKQDTKHLKKPLVDTNNKEKLQKTTNMVGTHDDNK